MRGGVCTYQEFCMDMLHGSGLKGNLRFIGPIPLGEEREQSHFKPSAPKP